MSNERNEMDRQILQRRAAELAKQLDQLEQREERLPVLEFTLMGMPYAIYLDKVEAVTRIGDIFSIPLTPRHISGIIRRRGQSIALISLRHFFHNAAEGLADADFAVIVNARGKRFALQVEEIQGVIHILRNSLKPPPDNFDPAQTPFLAGIAVGDLSIIDVDLLVEAHGFGMDTPAM